MAAASAAAFAKATSSRPKAVEVLARVGEDAGAAANGSEEAAAVEAAAADVEAEPPIGGDGSVDAASIAGEVGALDAMELEGEMEELELGRR